MFFVSLSFCLFYIALFCILLHSSAFCRAHWSQGSVSGFCIVISVFCFLCFVLCFIFFLFHFCLFKIALFCIVVRIDLRELFLAFVCPHDSPPHCHPLLCNPPPKMLMMKTYLCFKTENIPQIFENIFLESKSICL